MQAVEADQRVIRRAEQIAADRQVMPGDQLAPFVGRAQQEATPSTIVAAHQRRKPAWSPVREAFVSARWIVTLLDKKQSVVPMTSGSESASAGVGPTVSFPRNVR